MGPTRRAVGSNVKHGSCLPRLLFPQGSPIPFGGALPCALVLSWKAARPADWAGYSPTKPYH